MRILYSQTHNLGSAVILEGKDGQRYALGEPADVLQAVSAIGQIDRALNREAWQFIEPERKRRHEEHTQIEYAKRLADEEAKKPKDTP